MKLVIHPAVDTARLAKIEATAPSMLVVNARDEQEALESIEMADAFFGRLTPELLSRAKQLRWVQCPTASLEHYVFPALVEHPLQLTNMRGLFSDVIADHVFGYVLCFARNLHRYIRQQAEQNWNPIGGEESRVGFVSGPGQVSPMDVAHRHLSDQTLGVVGLGAIGSEIAVRANAFGMRVLAMDPSPQDSPARIDEIFAANDLERMLDQSDYVVVAAPHTPHTEGMFRRAQFQAMNRDAYFINIGRGAIVSLDDLNAALEADEIAGAALDVFEVEPLPPEHPLWKRENVIITPHVAGASPRIAERHLAVFLDNLDRFVHSQPLKNVANKALWY